MIYLASSESTCVNVDDVSFMNDLASSEPTCEHDDDVGTAVL